MSAFDLRNCSPDQVAATKSVTEIAEVVKAIEQWGQPEARSLDMIYRTMVIQALHSHRTQEPELLDLSRLLGLSQHPRRKQQLAELGYFDTRWHLLRELVDEQIERLRRRRPARATEIQHGNEVLCLLLENDDQISQSQLASRLPLGSPSNVTRVLTQLVNCGAVVRRKVGRNNVLALTHEGRAIALIAKEKLDEEQDRRALRQRIERLKMGAAQLRCLVREDLPFDRFRPNLVTAVRRMRRQLQTSAPHSSSGFDQCALELDTLCGDIETADQFETAATLVESANKVVARCSRTIDPAPRPAGAGRNQGAPSD